MEQHASKSFNDCSTAFLEKTFALVETTTSKHLEEWLEGAKDITLAEYEQLDLEQLRLLLNANVRHWNEQELSLHFIGPVLSKAQFLTPERRFNLFAQRPLSGNVTDKNNKTWHLHGKPDEMIAAGFREPEAPFFCFNAYKKEAEPLGDPAGQLLAAMLTGRSLNPPAQPMYGCYVIGRDWYFVTLVGRQYCISRDYSAVTEDVSFILRVLKSLKMIVQELTKDMD